MSMLENAAVAVLDEYAGYGREMPEHIAIELARAVLLAVREPDEAVTEAGWSANPNINDKPLWKNTVDVQASARFTAMIDAILQEKPE